MAADRCGRRAVILGGVATLVVACAVAGTAGHDTVWLSIGLGLGWSATMVAGSLQLSESRRPGASARPGLMGSAGAAASAAGLVVHGSVTGPRPAGGRRVLWAVVPCARRVIARRWCYRGARCEGGGMRLTEFWARLEEVFRAGTPRAWHRTRCSLSSMGGHPGVGGGRDRPGVARGGRGLPDRVPSDYAEFLGGSRCVVCSAIVHRWRSSTGNGRAAGPVVPSAYQSQVAKKPSRSNAGGDDGGGAGQGEGVEPR